MNLSTFDIVMVVVPNTAQYLKSLSIGYGVWKGISALTTRSHGKKLIGTTKALALPLLSLYFPSCLWADLLMVTMKETYWDTAHRSAMLSSPVTRSISFPIVAAIRVVFTLLLPSSVPLKRANIDTVWMYTDRKKKHDALNDSFPRVYKQQSKSYQFSSTKISWETRVDP